MVLHKEPLKQPCPTPTSPQGLPRQRTPPAENSVENVKRKKILQGGPRRVTNAMVSALDSQKRLGGGGATLGQFHGPQWTSYKLRDLREDLTPIPPPTTPPRSSLALFFFLCAPHSLQSHSSVSFHPVPALTTLSASCPGPAASLPGRLIVDPINLRKIL